MRFGVIMDGGEIEILSLVGVGIIIIITQSLVIIMVMVYYRNYTST